MQVYVVMYAGDVDKIFAQEKDAREYIKGIEELHEIKVYEVIT